MAIVLDMAIPALVLALAYAWLVYPLLLAAVGRRRAAHERAAGDAALPRVAVLLSAHNEEACVRPRIENLLALDYPPDRLKIHVGSDGSTDRTAEAARAAAARDGRVVVREFAVNRGKVAVLKEMVSAESGEHGASQAGACEAAGAECLVFTDANTVFRPDALRRLVRHFSDPQVGAVCGRLLLRRGKRPLPASSGSNAFNDLNDFNGSNDSPEGAYWRLENRLKEWESALDSCLGVNGAIYAMRPELFWREVPDNTLVDDFVLGMKVRERGKRVLYEPRAIAEEELPEIGAEWVRRVRIGAGDYQALMLCRRCLLPRYGRFAWMFWSHKVLRWFTPHILLAAAVCAAAGAGIGSRTGSLVLAGLALFGLCAIPFAACRHFLAMQAALFAGFVRFCRGNLRGAWKRTPRGRNR